MKQTIIKNEKYEVWDDGTFRFHHWMKNDISEWKIEGDGVYYRHIGQQAFVKATEHDNSVQDKWADKIMAFLVERELLSDSDSSRK